MVAALPRRLRAGLSFLPSATVVVLGLLSTACAGDDPRWSNRTSYLGAYSNTQYARRQAGLEDSPLAQSTDDGSFWSGGGRGSPRIEIRLAEQRAYFFKGGDLAGVSSISSGKEGYDTPAGSYRIIQKDKDHRSSLYGRIVDASTGQVLIEDADTKRDRVPKGARFEGAPMPNFMRIVGGVGMHAGYLPGVPASHGCIRMPPYMSEHFFENAPHGTPVVVSR